MTLVLCKGVIVMIVVINHQGFFKEPSWHMEVNLEQVCNLVGKKIQAQNSSGTWVNKAAYSNSNLKKVLKLIFQNCSEDEIEHIEQYFNKHNKKCADEFKKIRSKGR